MSGVRGARRIVADDVDNDIADLGRTLRRVDIGRTSRNGAFCIVVDGMPLLRAGEVRTNSFMEIGRAHV